MIKEGQIVLFRFPQTDQAIGKLRPALVVKKLPASQDDWLICMVSTKLDKKILGFDETITEEDREFAPSGLKKASVIRISRLAVVNKSMLVGSIGEISAQRLQTIKKRLSDWIVKEES